MNGSDALDRLVADLAKPRARLAREVSGREIDGVALAERLRALGYDVTEWSAAGSLNPDFDLMNAMIGQLRMTDVYAANWDAVEEGLQYRADGAPPPTAVVVTNADAFRMVSPSQWKQAFEIFTDRGKEWRGKGLILRAVFVT